MALLLTVPFLTVLHVIKDLTTADNSNPLLMLL